MTKLTYSTGCPVPFQPAPVKKFRGTRLPGADLRQAIEDTYSVSFHHFTTDLFQISLRNFCCTANQSFQVTETIESIRLETVLTGELHIKKADGSEVNLLPGQYRITEEKSYEFEIKSSQGCQYFVVFMSAALLEQTPVGETIRPSEPRMMSDTMREVIHRILDNPFEEKLRDASYDYRVRELLFYHIAAPPFTMPGELTPAEQAAVYAADTIIASNLNVHYTIPELARMVNTNVYVLKTGFPKTFGASVLDRLLQRKMDRAKFLLETTDKQIQEISELSGYETPTGFINAFKKMFKISPKDWRKKSRGLM